MYNIYVTNKSADIVYVRLHPQRINNLGVDIHQQWTGAVADASSLHSLLMRWEFCPIPPCQPVPFVIGMDRNYDSTRRLFASLYANSKLWFMDKEVDYLNFGCLFIRTTLVTKTSEEVLYLTQENPEPVWLPAKKGDKLPERNLIKVDSAAYFGRHNGRNPCRVTSSNGQCEKWVTGDGYESYESGALLKTNGHQWLRALSGDPVPPNSVIVGLSDTEGSLYLGRVGGNIPCSISSENGKIKQFCLGHKKRMENGELMVLTNDTKDLC